jgi:hypothetical protein
MVGVLYHNYSILPWLDKGINEWAWLCSNKTLPKKLRKGQNLL